MCVCETEEQADKDRTKTNAPPLCNKHTVAFTSQKKVTFCKSHTVDSESKDMSYNEIKITLNKTNQK